MRKSILRLPNAKVLENRLRAVLEDARELTALLKLAREMERPIEVSEIDLNAYENLLNEPDQRSRNRPTLARK